ncbi:cadherin domain-containing protein, partial [Rhizobium phaseoli]
NFSDYAVSTWSDVGVFLVDQRPASFGQTTQIGEVESFVFADGTRSFDAVVHSPRSIALDVASVAENSAVGTVVGLLSATDPDAGDALTLSLTEDAGGRFAVVGNQLVVNGPLDFETAASHQVTARVTDGTGNTYDRTFTIDVLYVNDSVNLPPTDISLSASTIVENSPAGTAIGTLTTSDPDAGETFTYQLL